MIKFAKLLFKQQFNKKIQWTTTITGNNKPQNTQKTNVHFVENLAKVDTAIEIVKKHTNKIINYG
jgi:hypothetical protein